MNRAPFFMDAAAGNRRLASIYYQKVMNKADVSSIPRILNEEFTFTIPTHPEVYRGVEGFTEEVTGLHGAFPDVHLDVHHLWCFDDLILGLWTGTGTHNGSKPLSTPNGPLPATNREFVIEGVSWIHADGILLRENLANEDTLKIVHDLGVKDSTPLYRAADASLITAAQFPASAAHGSMQADLLQPWARLNHPLLLQEADSRAQIQSFFSAYWRAFSNVDWRITHAKRGSNVIAHRWVFEADHTGTFFAIPATGRRVHHQGVTVSLVGSEGRIERMYMNENLVVLLGQMSANA